MGIQTKVMTSIPQISGLSYLPGFITADQSAALIAEIDNQAWRSDLKRRVQHYGYIYDYRARAISQEMKLGPLPDWLSGLAAKLTETGIFKTPPDQIIINEYEPGEGISAHIDCVPCFGDVIASLSLGGAVDMSFKKEADTINLRLEPNSLLVLTDEARYKWQHAIASRKSDKVNSERVPRSRRVSLTFRTVKIEGV
jgi:alkylated DNA repair dioxygenase AlkB